MPSPRSNNVDEWITHFNEVDGGPGWGVGVLLDEIERLREELRQANAALRALVSPGTHIYRMEATDAQ